VGGLTATVEVDCGEVDCEVEVEEGPPPSRTITWEEGEAIDERKEEGQRTAEKGEQE
jgi:hypothetical protein